LVTLTLSLEESCDFQSCLGVTHVQPVRPALPLALSSCGLRCCDVQRGRLPAPAWIPFCWSRVYGLQLYKMNCMRYFKPSSLYKWNWLCPPKTTTVVAIWRAAILDNLKETEGCHMARMSCFPQHNQNSSNMFYPSSPCSSYHPDLEKRQETFASGELASIPTRP